MFDNHMAIFFFFFFFIFLNYCLIFYMRITIFQKFIDFVRKKDNSHLDPNIAVKTDTIAGKIVAMGQDGNDTVLKHLRLNRPELICRFGTVELETVREMIKEKAFSKNQRRWMGDTAGFFPLDDDNLIHFVCEQVSILKDIDVLGTRKSKYEIEIDNLYINQADFVCINSIMFPFLFENPWSQYLKGKKVLVINPFEDTIKKQYEKREKLFKNPEVLPEFDLLTYKPVQGIGRAKNKLKYKTWFEALAKMKEDIKNIDFDIAIIGAGAYGMFLAQYVKSVGKQAIHMGGATQLLFGIKGNRWDNCFGDLYYNKYWTRPSKDETPEGVELFERGTMAYW